MVTNDVNSFIEHYGVMGMHWGVRNDEVNKSKKSKLTVNFDIREIAERQGRKKLEKRYRELNSRDTNRGERFIRDNIGNIVLGTVGVVVAGTAGHYVLDTLDRKLPRSPFAYMMGLILGPIFKR